MRSQKDASVRFRFRETRRMECGHPKPSIVRRPVVRPDDYKDTGRRRDRHIWDANRSTVIGSGPNWRIFVIRTRFACTYVAELRAAPSSKDIKQCVGEKRARVTE